MAKFTHKKPFSIGWEFEDSVKSVAPNHKHNSKAIVFTKDLQEETALYYADGTTYIPLVTTEGDDRDKLMNDFIANNQASDFGYVDRLGFPLRDRLGAVCHGIKFRQMMQTELEKYATVHRDIPVKDLHAKRLQLRSEIAQLSDKGWELCEQLTEDEKPRAKQQIVDVAAAWEGAIGHFTCT
ncbi:hypothetical protein S40285_10005 [Stachybotrys chlorohalonatus IBT 40285]|uniref:Uncharacterized protein n=1 Tax=Stachybotrys chlorohalonatus (strain IBT 40285) TaxID=1283841 RepID=A0A084QWT2_STAC4|nr:hypothetical protein S40285_10005 [Stachybotrys chlorohalonata IBT 40285]